MTSKPKSDRNRAIYAAAAAGQSIEQLATAYGLTPVRVRALITDEGHRRAVSQDAYYRDLRRPRTGRRAITSALLAEPVSSRTL